MELHQKFLQVAVQQAEFATSSANITTTNEESNTELLTSSPPTRKPIDEIKPPINQVVLPKYHDDGSKTELLSEEAPADPVN